MHRSEGPYNPRYNLLSQIGNAQSRGEKTLPDQEDTTLSHFLWRRWI